MARSIRPRSSARCPRPVPPPSSSPRRARFRCMRSALPSQTSPSDSSAPVPNAYTRECSRNRPSTLRTRMFSDKPGSPGRTPQIPRIHRSTGTARLRDERRRLDELQVGDLEVRASFQVSYDNLRAGRHRVDPAHAFRLLGLGPGQRISLNAAAALIGEPEADAADALETLVDANLLESPEPDWYQLHDLLRLFATAGAQAEEPEEARHSAVDRLLQWYLAMAETAADVISPQRYRMSPGEPHTQGLLLDSVEAALTWYDGERAGVITAIRQAAAAGRHDIAWQLAVALFALFDRRDNWADCITAHRIAIEGARAAGQRQAEAWTAQNLGQALVLV